MKQPSSRCNVSLSHFAVCIRTAQFVLLKKPSCTLSKPEFSERSPFFRILKTVTQLLIEGFHRHKMFSMYFFYKTKIVFLLHNFYYLKGL